MNHLQKSIEQTKFAAFHQVCSDSSNLSKYKIKQNQSSLQVWPLIKKGDHSFRRRETKRPFLKNPVRRACLMLTLWKLLPKRLGGGGNENNADASSVWRLSEMKVAVKQCRGCLYFSIWLFVFQLLNWTCLCDTGDTLIAQTHSSEHSSLIFENKWIKWGYCITTSCNKESIGAAMLTLRALYIPKWGHGHFIIL